MKKQLRILLAGVVVVVPFAITVYVICWAGAGLDALGSRAMQQFSPSLKLLPGVGAIIVIATIYLVGVGTHFWLFRGAVALLERLVAHVPGVKTIYESLRDLMKLFGGKSRHMGKTVLFTPGESGIQMLAIMTNEHPVGAEAAGEQTKVALYLPYSYMFGGITIFVPRHHIQPVDMPVEQALKLCATAQVGARACPDPQPPPTAVENS